MIPRPSSNRLSPTSRQRAPARHPEPRMRLAVRGVPKGALRTHSASQAPLWGSMVTCNVLFARAPVLGLCFVVSVNILLVKFLESVSTVVGCKIPRKENPPMFRFFGTPPPSCFPGFTRGWPDDWKKQALRIQKLGWLNLLAGFTRKKASTRRVNRKLADSTRNQRVFFSRYLAANYGVSRCLHMFS